MIDELYKKYDELYETNEEYKETNTFKLPIQYIENQEVNDIIKNDLEMPNIYKHLVGDSIINWSSYYTTNKSFLKETQKHIQTIPSIETNNTMLEKYRKFKSKISNGILI